MRDNIEHPQLMEELFAPRPIEADPSHLFEELLAIFSADNTHSLDDWALEVRGPDGKFANGRTYEELLTFILDCRTRIKELEDEVRFLQKIADGEAEDESLLVY